MTLRSPMADSVVLHPAGLAGLLSALQPRVEAAPPPPPDLGAIRQDGWEAGFVAGEAAATAALAPLRVSLAEAAAALAAATEIDVQRLRPLFAALVERIASAVLGAELSAGAQVLLPLVEAALAQVRSGEAAVLAAHPATLAALQPHLPDVAVHADLALAPGQFVVTGAEFVIDTSLSERLAAILAEVA